MRPEGLMPARMMEKKKKQKEKIYRRVARRACSRLDNPTDYLAV